MLLIGLDAASDRRKFGYAIGYAVGGSVSIRQSGLLADRGEDGITRICDALSEADAGLIAVDAPLGWPIALGETLAGHAAGEQVAAGKHMMFRRATDRRLREAAHGGHQPLEVGADRIARATHEALSVLAELRARSGRTLAMAWSPVIDGFGVIEVYPAATLRARGLSARTYKPPEQGAARELIAEACRAQLPGLPERCARTADEFDACLCLLAALDFLEGRCAPPPPELCDTARREGWIWVRSR